MRTIAILAAAALLVPACASGGDEAPNEPAREAEPLTIQATEFEFLMPEELPAGESSYTFENVGGQPHFFEVVQVEDDVTDAQVEQALSSPEEPEWLLGPAQGFGLLTSGQAAVATATYDPGNYLFVCFMPDAEGKAHAELGMWNLVTVAGDPTSSVSAPDGALPVEVGAEGWTLPDMSEVSGEVVFEITGLQKSGRHSFEVGRLVDESLAPEDVVPAFEEWVGGGYAGPAPVALLGGLLSVPAKDTRYLTISFEPGTYVFHDQANPEGDELVTIG
jgi:hypothetical protein